MKRSIPLFTVLIAVLLPLSADGAEIHLSLADCLKRALSAALEINQGRYSPLLAQTQVTEAEAEFDHLLTFNTTEGRTREPSTSYFSGAPVVVQQTFTGSVALSRKTTLGTLYSLTFGTNELLTNSTFSNFRPLWTNTLTFSVTQPLLRGAFKDVNEAGIREAEQGLTAAREDYRGLVENTLAAVEKAYWRLVFLRGDVMVKEQSETTAKELLRVARQRLAAGAGTKIDVVQAEAGLAEREKELLLARAAEEDGQDLLRAYVDPFDKKPTEVIEIVPTDAAKTTIPDALPKLAKQLRIAFDQRPDVLAQKARLESAGVEVLRTKNELLPRLDFTGSVNLIGDDNAFSQALQPIGTGDFPSWQIGVTLEFPLGNRAAKARHRRAVLARAQAVAGFESLKNQVVVQVRSAIRAIVTAKKDIAATRKASVAAEAQFKAEQDRVRADKATNYELLQVEQDLRQARTDQLAALVSYRDALVNLETASGTYVRSRGLEAPPATVPAVRGEGKVAAPGKPPARSGTAPR